MAALERVNSILSALPGLAARIDQVVLQEIELISRADKSLQMKPDDIAYTSKEIALSRRAMGWLKQVRKAVGEIVDMNKAAEGEKKHWYQRMLEAINYGKDYYAVLGIDPSATSDQIRSAYRVKARQFHPDLNPGVDTSDMMKDINEANEILSDPVKRRQYDGARPGGANYQSYKNAEERGAAYDQAYQDAYAQYGAAWQGSSGYKRTTDLDLIKEMAFGYLAVAVVVTAINAGAKAVEYFQPAARLRRYITNVTALQASGIRDRKLGRAVSALTETPYSLSANPSVDSDLVWLGRETSWFIQQMPAWIADIQSRPRYRVVNKQKTVRFMQDKLAAMIKIKAALEAM